jgi:uncharacterized membrane protein
MVDIAGFAFSYLILISIWLRYTSIMAVLPVETGGVMTLNLVMLFLVSIEPYLLGLLISGSVQTSRVGVLSFASEAYALDVAGLTLIMGLFARELTDERRGLTEPELAKHYRFIRNTQYIGAACFAITALPPFWSLQILGTPARFAVWYAILAFQWITRLSRRFEK